MGPNVSSKWNPTLRENVPAEKETRFLLVSLAIDNKCDFFGSKAASECFSFFLLWVLAILARWSLKLGMCRSMRLSRESSRCPWQTFVSPKSCLLPVSVAGAAFCPRKTRSYLTGSWAVFYMDRLHLRLELWWQVFLALLTGFVSSWTTLAFNGYWDPSPLWMFQLWHLEILLRKSLAIWASSSLNTCTADAPSPLSTASPSLPLQLSPSDSLPRPASSFPDSLWILASPFSQPINVMGAFSACSQTSVSIPCHEVKNGPAAFEEVQIYLDICPACFLVNKPSLICKTRKPSASSAWVLKGQLRAASFPSVLWCRLTVPMPKALTLSFSITSALPCVSISSKQPVE